ncbi:MAG: beta-galactosidase [Prolixibacteraceae bacterium]|nr:beta-galactosidase [Prolixibacteraceae bacterium]
MKKHLKLMLIIPQLFFLMSAFGQKAPADFFPENKLMTIGTFYFPEHWPEHQWERDFQNMANMGFEYVHMGEFAWTFLEPEEGQFQFDWLDRAIELAGKHGLKVLLCTPTATTPVWMGIKYPETYVMYSNYQRGEHGTRQNNSLSNPVFRKLSTRIVEEMAKHYGNNPHIWGWQLDNEPEAKEDYSPSAREAFQHWLEKRYGSIDSLNQAWGTAFWSITYRHFHEINIHNANAVGWWGSNPHALLDFKRFTASVQADFLNEQVHILRKYTKSNQFITTNYVSVAQNADPRLADQLDFAAFTSYPNGGSPNLGKDGFRLGDPDRLIQAHDYFRPIKGITGVMEIQPGQVNWGNPNALLLPGTVHMWLWHCFGAGSSFASSYRYRQILYGAEQYHAGIMKTDGITLAPGGIEYRQFIQEIRQLEKMKVATTVPERLQQMKTAILWSHDNLWDHSRQPQNGNWNLWQHVFKYHRALKALGATVDYISEKDDFNQYNMIIVPAYQSVDTVLVARWRSFVEQGGDLIISCRTATKDRNGHFWEAGWAAPIDDLIGAEIDHYDMLPGYQQAHVQFNGEVHAWNTWGELLNPLKAEFGIASYADQFYQGTTAVVFRKLGKGTVTYNGLESLSGKLEKELLKQRFAARGINTLDLPPGVFVSWNKGFWVAVNYSSEVQTIDPGPHARLVLGEKMLQPAGVLVWTETND